MSEKTGEGQSGGVNISGAVGSSRVTSSAATRWSVLRLQPTLMPPSAHWLRGLGWRPPKSAPRPRRNWRH
jgi:hypothetical protein